MIIALPAGLMPCLSRNAVSPLKESINVSNAESQLALPRWITTYFGSSVSGSPKGSAAWTGAAGLGVGFGSVGFGACCAAPGAGDGVGDGLAAGSGVGLGAGVGLAAAAGEGVAAGACANAAPDVSEIARSRISAARPAPNEAKRKLWKFMGILQGRA